MPYVGHVPRAIPCLLLTLSLLAACAGPATPAAPARPTLDPLSPAGRGQAVFSGKGRCATCHSLSPETVIVGPSLAGVATRAETRIPELSAADYLEEAIVRPDQYKVPGFEAVQMDTTLAKTLTSDEVTDVVAFLLTLR